MNSTEPQLCRRCGCEAGDHLQHLIDAEGRWAIVIAHCACGHEWTTLHAAPEHLAAMRRWVIRGCHPSEGPALGAPASPWGSVRLEGRVPALIQAS